MKGILIALLLFPLLSAAQTLDNLNFKFPTKNGRVVYQLTVDVKGMEKKSLFTSSMNWFFDNFKHSNMVIEIEDELTGHILGTGRLLIIAKTKEKFVKGLIFVFNFRIEIFCNDNKSIIKISDIEADAPGFFSHYNVPLEDFPFIKLSDPPKSWQLNRINVSKHAINDAFELLLKKFDNRVNNTGQDALNTSATVAY